METRRTSNWPVSLGTSRFLLPPESSPLAFSSTRSPTTTLYRRPTPKGHQLQLRPLLGRGVLVSLQLSLARHDMKSFPRIPLCPRSMLMNPTLPFQTRLRKLCLLEPQSSQGNAPLFDAACSTNLPAAPRPSTLSLITFS
jgi:hypothetical protein